MAFDFSVEPEFEKKLEWIREFVRDEVEPLEVLFPGCEFLPLDDERRRIVDPLKQKVREQGLWAPHLGPELGGQGFGAVKLTLINEILGRATWSSIIFGTQAPDTGNAEIIARFGTQEQKDTYLAGLLSGEIFSTFSMTEGLALAFGPTVRVNTLMPGPFLTDISKAWDFGTANPFGRHALQRAGQPDEIIGAALFLMSDASSFTTGSILRADGGIP